MTLPRLRHTAVVAFANADQITVLEIGNDLDVVEKGNPIVFEGQGEWYETNVAVSDQWLAVGRRRSSDWVVRVYRFEEGDWFQNGNEIRMEAQGGNRISVALSVPSMDAAAGGIPSPTLVVGLPHAHKQRSTNSSLSTASVDGSMNTTNNTNNNETGVGPRREGIVRIFRRA